MFNSEYEITRLQGANHSIDHLKQLFLSKFNLIADTPDSFQMWNQTFGSGNTLTFIMVDMDKIKAQNLVAAANDLLGVIMLEDGLTLRQNNRDHWMAIALPCGCDQEHSPFPSLQQIPKSSKYIPIPGEWHDPNKCTKQRPPSPIVPPSNSGPNTVATLGYMPMPVSSLSGGDIPMSGVSAMASYPPSNPVKAEPGTGYAGENDTTISPTGSAVYSSPVFGSVGYNLVAGQGAYTALPCISSGNVGVTAPTDQPFMDTSASTEHEMNRTYSASFLEWYREYHRNATQPGNEQGGDK
ncbi:hypothetical protein F5B22DRAFT_643188 [Xylaria bambusicola]|uniref:uncharacterized protein n=1 Tax=Xylaria bambusicola TaxID=326684 RepID=UPI002008BCFF|nr:uncharacterized protein F5B22DRAFT_643188 [Xylaria bambusicola]KAI0522167.1 hypothetical protein F5B22DRAFT_643188 [Xylaria bambusicola]